MKNISVIEVDDTKNISRLTTESDGPALVLDISNNFCEGQEVTLAAIKRLLTETVITDSEAVHRVVLISSSVDRQAVVRRSSLEALQREFSMRMLAVDSTIQIAEESTDNPSEVLAVRTAMGESCEGDLNVLASSSQTILLFEPLRSTVPKASLETAHLFYDIPLHRGRRERNLAAFAKGPLPIQVERNQRLLRKAWRIASEKVWGELPEDLMHIFRVGDEEERQKESYLPVGMRGTYEGSAGWFALPHISADRFPGRLINAPYGSTMWTGSVSHGFQQLLSCPEVFHHGRKKIVCTEQDFSAIKHVAQNFVEMAKHFGSGLDCETIASTDSGFFNAEHFIGSLQKDDVAIAILPHVGFKNGERIEDATLKKIASIARDRGIIFAIDGAHALGDQRIDVNDLDPDVYFSTLMKEGSGSAGSAFMYVRPDIDLHPRLTSWLSHADAFAHKEKFSYHADRRQRFYGGTPSIATYYQCIEGARIMIEVGLENVEVDTKRKVEAALSALTARGLEILSPLEENARSALIVIKTANPHDIEKRLFEEFGIRVYGNVISTNGVERGIIRISPHLCCTLQETIEACEAIADVIQSYHSA